MKKVFRGALCACLAGLVLASCEPVDQGGSGGQNVADVESNPVYMMEVNPANGEFYVGLAGSKYVYSGKVYRYGIDGLLIDDFDVLCNPSRAAFLGNVKDSVKDTPDVFILCEGLWQQNNAEVSAYNSHSMQCIDDYYYRQNDQYLGDTGQDILWYNGYLYVSVSGSSYVAKLDSEGREVARCAISATEGQPRYLAAEGDYLYVTLYSGRVAKMKTSDLSVVDYAPVGKNPEDVVVYKDMLLVANSGWGYDNTVTIIDVATFDSIGSITVEWNPQQLVVAGDSVYLLANGQYDDNWNCDYPVQSIRVEERTARTIAHATHATAYSGKLYMCNSVVDYTTGKTVNSFFTYDVETAILDNTNFLDE
ncbi:MAG: hypothetical protein IKJ18_05205 [Bacteroidaceae bacterium]|nr:hypothetical protein [Bacteroidaceae bacterium]